MAVVVVTAAVEIVVTDNRLQIKLLQLLQFLLFVSNIA
jgi:hypothetical protein